MTELRPDRPTVVAVVPLAAAVYARHCAGCCLHILLDDGNVDDDDAAFCLSLARERGHADCQELAGLLATMSKTQRKKVRARMSRA